MFDEYIDKAVTKHTGSGANYTKSVKLTWEQIKAIDMSGETPSQWIREAVQMRIDSGE